TPSALGLHSLSLHDALPILRENLAFGLNGKGDQEVKKVAEMLGIGHLLDRFPAELSGGEQQRVALGPAIVRRPAALLLAEPLSRDRKSTRLNSGHVAISYAV